MTQPEEKERKDPMPKQTMITMKGYIICKEQDKDTFLDEFNDLCQKHAIDLDYSFTTHKEEHKEDNNA